MPTENDLCPYHPAKALPVGAEEEAAGSERPPKAEPVSEEGPILEEMEPEVLKAIPVEE